MVSIDPREITTVDDEPVTEADLEWLRMKKLRMGGTDQLTEKDIWRFKNHCHRLRSGDECLIVSRGSPISNEELERSMMRIKVSEKRFLENSRKLLTDEGK